MKAIRAAGEQLRVLSRRHDCGPLAVEEFVDDVVIRCYSCDRTLWREPV